MGISIQRRRGTTSDHSSFTGKVGEITVDTTLQVPRIHDGTTVGGWPCSRFDHTHSIATESVAGFYPLQADKTKLDGIVGGAANYQVVQLNGSAQPQEINLNLSNNFSATDDPGGNRTTVDLSTTGVSNGTYTKVTVNSTGRVTFGITLVAGDIPNLTVSKLTNLTTTVQGYTLDLFAAAAADVNLNGNKVINLADPIASTDAATKNYVDNIAVGLYFKAACRAASTANVNLSAPGTTIDTVSLNIGDRVLIKNQITATQNGIYVFNGASTPMSRALDANSGAELQTGTFVFIGTEGSVNGDSAWVLSTTGTITIGTTSITFVQFSAGGNFTAGNGIQIVSNAIIVQTVSSGRITVGSSGIDLATTAVTPGTYNNLSVDAYGRATAGSTASYQAQNANLTGLAGLSTTGLAVRTGAGTFSTASINPGTGISVTNGNGVAGNVGVAVVADTTNSSESRSLKRERLQEPDQKSILLRGTGITITQTDNSGSNRVDMTIAVSGGGGGAPSTSQYVTLATDINLSNERVLTAGTGITLTDGGAGGNITLALQTDLGTVP